MADEPTTLKAPLQEEILERAENRRQAALRVIETLGLVERWSQFGKPLLVGSVRHGLVVAPDIDLDIYTDRPQVSAGFQVTAGLAELPGVWKVRFANELDGPDEGLYWQIRYRAADGEIWKVDNWLLSRKHPQAEWDHHFPLALERALTPETRAAILRIKETLAGQPGMRGIDIYQAVVAGGVRTPQDYQEWLTAEKPPGFNYWMPTGG